jgi:tRNA threonylcarbamoyladenosine biosynthesis protein TsaE
MAMTIEPGRRVSSAAEMKALGQRLGAALRVGDGVALVGPLGAGKTTFVQGLARGMGVAADRHVASPTFALVNEHPGHTPLVHADFYRVNDAREIAELGLDEAYDRAAVVVEWAERFPEAAIADRLIITLAIEPDGARRLTAEGTGARGVALAGVLMAGGDDVAGS